MGQIKNSQREIGNCEWPTPRSMAAFRAIFLVNRWYRYLIQLNLETTLKFHQINLKLSKNINQNNRNFEQITNGNSRCQPYLKVQSWTSYFYTVRNSTGLLLINLESSSQKPFLAHIYLRIMKSVKSISCLSVGKQAC